MDRPRVPLKRAGTVTAIVDMNATGPFLDDSMAGTALDRVKDTPLKNIQPEMRVNKDT